MNSRPDIPMPDEDYFELLDRNDHLSGYYALLRSGSKDPAGSIRDEQDADMRRLEDELFGWS